MLKKNPPAKEKYIRILMLLKKMFFPQTISTMELEKKIL
jgi:hypothetical protein